MPRISRTALVALTLALGPAGAAFAGDDLPDASELLEGYAVEDGLYKVYRKGHQTYLEVPARQLDSPFLLATSISGGPSYTGFQWWTTVGTWQRLDDRLLLIEKEVRYRVRDKRKPMHDVVERTYTDRLLHAPKIVALNGQNPVIDLNALFAGEAETFFGGVAAKLDDDVVMVEKVKAFPENVEVVMTLPDEARDGRFTSLAYSLRALPHPQSDRYRPREADDRVGYFLTAVKDFTDDEAKGDRFVRYVNRWRLEKADPSLDASPVKEPIIFYVENTVPYRFRQAVQDGILEWNRAFREIGLQGAVVVRQQTDTEFTELDPEDARYNFFRWIVSERSFAMGPSRVNPWTGQILDADIVFDESMVRHYLREYDVAIRTDARRLFPPGVERLLDADPARYPFAHVEGERRGARLHAPEARFCNLGPGVAHQVGIGLLAAQGRGYPDGFVNALVKDVVMHEVGHTLGLRHNFKASTWRSLAEINSDERPGVLCASVMDYNPINVVPDAGAETQGAYTNRTIGPYDEWAIRYGYAIWPDEESGRRETVAAVASPQYAYGTDEDVRGPDPHTTRWDLGRDPLQFARQRMDLAERLWGEVVDRVVDEGEGYADARRAVDMLLYDYQQAGLLASRFVGGQHVHRDHKGDPDARDPIVPVPAAKQRAALALVCERLLDGQSFRLPPSLLRSLGKGNWRHWGSNDSRRPHSYPYHRRVLDVQSWALFGLINPATLQRLIDTEAKAEPGADRVTVPEVFDAVSDAVFGPIAEGMQIGPGTAAQPAIPTVQRNLQRHYVNELIAMLLEGSNGGTPAVVRNQARLELDRLRGLVADQGELTRLDPYSHGHLLELRERIGKALEASFQIGGPAGDGDVVIRVGEGADDGEDERGPEGLPWNDR